MPPQSPARKSALSSRGVQLASSTVLGLAVILLVIATVASGLYEVYLCGMTAWMHG